MKAGFIFVLLLVVFAQVFSQNPSAAEKESERNYVKQEDSVDQLIDAYRQHNRNHGMQGFRVQIFTASGNRSKLLTDRVKSEFDAAYPGVRSYITYDEPYYKLRVGDFRNRLDAERFLKSISSEYVFAMVVVDRINLPHLSSSDETLSGDKDKESGDIGEDVE